jgi:hypothetical protein
VTAVVARGQGANVEFVALSATPSLRYGGLSDLMSFHSYRMIGVSFISTSLAMNCDNNKRALGAELWCKAQPP